MLHSQALQREVLNPHRVRSSRRLHRHPYISTIGYRQIHKIPKRISLQHHLPVNLALLIHHIWAIVTGRIHRGRERQPEATKRTHHPDPTILPLHTHIKPIHVVTLLVTHDPAVISRPKTTPSRHISLRAVGTALQRPGMQTTRGQIHNKAFIGRLQESTMIEDDHTSEPTYTAVVVTRYTLLLRSILARNVRNYMTHLHSGAKHASRYHSALRSSVRQAI